MAWSGGTFTRANGSTEWQDDAALGIGIEAGLHDAQDNDLATGINTCLTKDGQNTPTANLPMGGFKHTGAGSASGTGQYTTYNQLQDSTFAATVASVAINNTSAGTLTQSLFSNDASPTVLAIQKSRGATVGTNTIVANADVLGSIEFRGANGTGYTTAAQIRAIVDGAPGATNDMPGALVFYTTPDGSGTTTERMRIDDAGNVGIGRNNPGTFGNLEVGGSAYAATSINSSSGSGAVLILAANSTSETRINTNTNHPMVFYTNNTQRAVIAAAGNVGINATSPQARLHVGGATNSTTAAATYVGTVQIDESGITALTSAGGLEFKGSTTGSGYGSKIVGFDNGSLVFAQRFGAAAWTETCRLNTSGFLLVGTTNTDPVAGNVAGTAISSTGNLNITKDAAAALYVNRKTSDGDLLQWYKDGALVGAVSVAAGTVTYGPFAGYHWSQLSDGTAPVIAVGTVMESINELCEWPDETEERLPKCKVSDTVASTAVYGVFSNWDTDWTATNDMSIVSVGAYFCRVAAGTVLQIGDLLESAGNGMAQVQADDIIRSSTIGKVTALTQSHVEPDGSFCVPTVLYCG
jgi:hypothetical protein